MCPPEIPSNLNYSLAFCDFVFCGFPFLEGLKRVHLEGSYQFTGFRKKAQEVCSGFLQGGLQTFR